ncbi:MAG TPA: XisI protein [Blastocatellia bacterium]|nr:XisI protein [Blastocatellia bacterium]HMV86292.1 XisI protein [Blastocatellia bacterium]HMX29980.1 XisI protein [Blastocatellia bacterium]HMY76246.1 XisI protein [Blastocatellia bacterium]HMZ21217.1 XisI protein [Blastocatellia bacterium]
MDQLNRYREIIERILLEVAASPYTYGEVEDFTVFDRQNDRYFVMTQGWGKEGRVHHCLVHIDIIDGKFWIQKDGTEEGIATDLERAGVPKDHIVLGFRRPELRQYTEYAAA